MFYSIFKALIKPFFFLLYGIRVYGKEHMDYEGSMILISNHWGNLDPIILGVCMKKKVYFMAKAELFKFRPFAAVIRALGAFPVVRGKNDLGALSAAAEVLEKGYTFGIFPEGTRSKSGKILSFQPGAAFIALRSKTQILPVAIVNKPHFLRRMRIVLDAPIDVAPMADPALSLAENAKKITLMLHDKILELKGSVSCL